GHGYCWGWGWDCCSTGRRRSALGVMVGCAGTGCPGTGWPGTGGIVTCGPGPAPGCPGAPGAGGLGFDGSRSRTSMAPAGPAITTLSSVILSSLPPETVSPTLYPNTRFVLASSR